MAKHMRNGHVMDYRWRFGLPTPGWLDHAATPMAAWLGRRLGLMGLLNSEFIPNVERAPRRLHCHH